MAADPNRCLPYIDFGSDRLCRVSSGDNRLAHLVILFNGPSMCP
jgi:hypothetical protein